jgi:bifunctional non-homologous end joining protein LigD
VTQHQLRLELPAGAPGNGPGLALPRRFRLMEATAVDAPFDDADYLFEPWWPGARALAVVSEGALRLEVAGLADAAAAFPELVALIDQLQDDGAVLDGTLLVLDNEGRPDPDLLRLRLARGARLRGDAGRPAFVASDLLWSGGRPLMRRTFAARRARLVAVLGDGDRAIVGRAYPREGRLVAAALARLGIDGLSARNLRARHRGGPAGDAWLRAPVEPSAPRGRPTLALIQRLPLDEAS